MAGRTRAGYCGAGVAEGGLGMDFRIGTQQRDMVAAVRDLAQTEFKPNAGRYMDGTFPWDNMKSLAAMGVLGMTVPEEYGGLGLPGFDTALILEEVAKGF